MLEQQSLELAQSPPSLVQGSVLQRKHQVTAGQRRQRWGGHLGRVVCGARSFCGARRGLSCKTHHSMLAHTPLQHSLSAEHHADTPEQGGELRGAAAKYVCIEGWGTCDCRCVHDAPDTRAVIAVAAAAVRSAVAVAAKFSTRRRAAQHKGEGVSGHQNGCKQPSVPREDDQTRLPGAGVCIAV